MVTFCFGEIDVRCHIFKHISETMTYTKIIDSLVTNYFLQIKKSTSNRVLKIAIFNVVPPVRKNTCAENHKYPFLGSDEQRKEFTLYFNKKLKEKCDEYKYVFVDVYKYYADSNGFLISHLSDGGVHINEEKYIKAFLFTLLTKADLF